YERRHPLRKVDINPGTETDHAETFARPYRLVHAYEANDTTRNEARDLHDRNPSGRYRNHQRIAFVIETRLVQVGIEEFAGLIHDFFDLSGDGTPVHVAIENTHKYRNSRQRPVSEAEFAWRRRTRDLAH